MFHQLAAEALPGVIIQTAAVLNNPAMPSRTAIISIIVSAITTGFTSAQISYDFDTDPKKRAQTPQFYGYVPDEPRKRSIIFFMLCFVPTFQILMKSLTLVILYMARPVYVFGYIGEDVRGAKPKREARGGNLSVRAR